MLRFVYASLLSLAVWIPRPQEQLPQSSPAPAPGSMAHVPDASRSPKGGSPATSDPATALLREGTPVKLKLLHTLNSKTVTPGDPLNFSLAEDVVVDGQMVVKAGTAAIGRVRQAKPARTLGRGAQLALEVEYLKAGPLRIPLRGAQMREGEGKKGETAALVVAFGLSGLIKHGSEIEVKEGSVFSAFVDEDTNVPLASPALRERDR